MRTQTSHIYVTKKRLAIYSKKLNYGNKAYIPLMRDIQIHHHQFTENPEFLLSYRSHRSKDYILVQANISRERKYSIQGNNLNSKSQSACNVIFKRSCKNKNIHKKMTPKKKKKQKPKKIAYTQLAITRKSLRHKTRN